ncbi:hypothetical protein BCV70DRAFT_199176 [Testicularia cyperi]|uniref:NEDD8-activating enzyme E1 regulatory subunit n=1 Tax=Testicularia cyperi TaxID=1882483 RepID=A0A317XTY7_9BASI|nr:hypothetical protein BCV70DRAFT_199176 [Testicularia cyperi]
MSSIGVQPLPPTDSTLSASHRPSAHTQRYDRQLRLWASSGQSSLEKANILVVGASALSAQILKNLVLPGIGSFVLLDDARVHPADLGVNFFLQPGESEGRYAVEEMVRLLVEMNSSVGAKAEVKAPLSLLELGIDYLGQFTLVISVNQPLSFDLALSDLLWSLRPPSPQVPLIRARSAGMIGEFSISVKELGIIETHPDSVVDLRLTRPFPELVELAQTFDLATTDSMEHSHIPFPIILLKKLSEWQAQNGGSLPTSKDRDALAKSINAARMPGNADAENFDEAIAALGKHVWRPIASNGVGGGGVPDEVNAILGDPACDHITSSSINFWILVRALREFVAASPTRSLPLSGSIPDMKATSSTYIKLQNVYRAKALQDLAQFQQILSQICQQNGVEGRIGDDEVEAFVKHAGYLKLVRGSSERQRHDAPNPETAMLAFMDPVNPCTFQHHIALAAANELFADHGRYPGSTAEFSSSVTSASAANPSSTTATSSTSFRGAGTRHHTASGDGLGRATKRQKSETPTGDGDGNSLDVKMADADASGGESSNLAEDEGALLTIAKKIASGKYNVEAESDEWEKVEESVKELVRSGHSSLPATTALLGGVVAQETIKLITKQYIPADNTVIYDGIQQAIGVFRI